MSTITTYSLAARIIHWAMALLLISLLLAGLAMVQSLEPWHLTLLSLHKSFGVMALVLVIIRLALRLSQQQQPDLPASGAALATTHRTVVALLFYMRQCLRCRYRVTSCKARQVVRYLCLVGLPCRISHRLAWSCMDFFGKCMR